MNSQNNFLALFKDICNGYSVYYAESLKANVFLKHPSQGDLADMQDVYDKNLLKYKKLGILSEQEQINFASENGWWSAEKENEILFLEKLIDRLISTRKKLMYENDKSRINEQILENQNKLNDLKLERSSYITTTAEVFANQKYTDLFIKNFIYKNRSLSEKLFDTISIDDQDFYDFVINECLVLFYRYTEEYSALQIKRVALSPIMQNIMFVSSNVYDIFGKPISQMTQSQYYLVLWSKYYQNYIKNINADIPESVYDNPETFVDWVESVNKRNNSKQQPKRQKRERNSNFSKKSEFLFGEKEEIEKFTNSEITGNKIINKAQEKGVIDFMELIDS